MKDVQDILKVCPPFTKSSVKTTSRIAAPLMKLTDYKDDTHIGKKECPENTEALV